jgi:hypothetical protein
MSELAEALTLIDRSKGKKGQQSLDDLKRADDLLEVALATDPSNIRTFIAIGHLHSYAEQFPFFPNCFIRSLILRFLYQPARPRFEGRSSQYNRRC